MVSSAKTIIAGSFLALLMLGLMGWQKPVIDEIRGTNSRDGNTKPVAITLCGRDCMPGRLDIGPRMVDGCTAFSCKVRINQALALTADGFRVRIVCDAFQVDMTPQAIPPGQIGVVCRIGPDGQPPEHAVFSPIERGREQPFEVEVAVCCAPPEKTPDEAGDQRPGNPGLTRVSVAGISRDCPPAASWAEAGCPVTFELSEVRPCDYKPGSLVEISDIRFAGIPADCCGMTKAASTGRRNVVLADAATGFGLAVVE